MSAVAPGDQSRSTRALVVDDERMNREVILANLRVGGYETGSAVDGQDAWEILEADPEGFDVILLDRRMPRMDGMALLAKLKAHEKLRDIPVIMQTAYAAPEDIAEGLSAGVYYYLAKPLDRRTLMSVVASAVDERMRFRRLQNDLQRGTTAMSLMDKGTFTFRSLDEGNTLAVALSRACPPSRFLVVGLSEIFTNAVEHGNLGITSAEKEKFIAEKRWTREIAARLDAPENRSKIVTVEFARKGEDVSITVRDQGKGFDWRAHSNFDPARAFAAHGRGIAMARRMCFESVEFRDPGNEVVLTISGKGAKPQAVVFEGNSDNPVPVADDAPRLADADDLRLARSMQMELLPRQDQLDSVAFRSGMKITGFVEYSSDLGGDMWGVDVVNDHQIALWLADFSGHGVTAAVNTFRMHALISSLDEVRGQPEMFLAELNRRLAGALKIGQYATMIYGVVNLETGMFDYAAAAAPPPIVVNATSMEAAIGDGSGLPLGVTRNAAYQLRRLPMPAGSLVFMASDALAENPMENRSPMGAGAIPDLVLSAVKSRGLDVDVQAILAPSLATMVRPPRDDLTALCCVRPV